jgi:hypothetical protein
MQNINLKNENRRDYWEDKREKWKGQNRIMG